MKKLSFCTQLALPADTAATEVYAFMGQRGSGKTYGAGVLVEELLSRDEQVVVLDPVGVWWGLRLLADGKHPTDFHVPVFGGKHGDVPLTEVAGPLVAKLLAERGTSAVLDVSRMRKGARKRFVTDLLEELFTLKKEADAPRPLHLVLEEARVFCPQKPQKGEERMLGAVEDVVRQGRSVGFGCTLIDQRPQSVNKDALNQASVLVAMRMQGAHERKAITDWVVENANDTGALHDLPSLKVGEAVVWAPEILHGAAKAKINQKITYDASSTPTLKSAKAERAAPLAMADLDALKAAMVDVEKEVAENDPKRLKQRIADLERALAKAPGLTFDDSARRRLRALAGMRDDPAIPLLDVAEKLERDATALAAKIVHYRNVMQQAADDAMKQADKLRDGAEPREPRAHNIPSIRASAVPRRAEMFVSPKPHASDKYIPRVAHPDVRNQKSGLKKGAREMLFALARRHPTPLTRDQVATLAGLSPRSGTFSDYLSALRSGGYVEERSWDSARCLALTDAGLAIVGTTPTAVTPDDVLAMWLGKIKKAGARRMLQLLVDSGPLGRETLGEAAGLSARSGTFSDYLSILRRNGLIEETDGGLRAAQELRA